MKKIIDIRSSDKYNAGHIPGAINITASNLLDNPSRYLNKYDTYYLYCTTGYTSGMIVSKLKLLGYNVVNIDGGYNKYLLRK